MSSKYQISSRRRNVHIYVEQSGPKQEGKRFFESLRDAIGLITAGTGIFAALLYLAGRSFAIGYFGAMNIPEYQVSFSLWEYGEVAWRPMFFYPTLMLGAGGLFWTVFYGLRDIVAPWLDRFMMWLKGSVKVTLPRWLRPEFSKRTRQWLTVTWVTLLVLMFMLVVDNTLNFVEEWGTLSGETYVTEKAAKVDLVSTRPLALDDNNLAPIQSSGQNYYVYQGLHLLTFNNGKYYLFKEINQATCKPTRVYVIDSDEINQVNLFPAASLVAQCHKQNSENTIPVSTATH